MTLLIVYLFAFDTILNPQNNMISKNKFLPSNTTFDTTLKVIVFIFYLQCHIEICVRYDIESFVVYFYSSIQHLNMRRIYIIVHVRYDIESFILVLFHT